jgi:hypothetical protein
LKDEDENPNENTDGGEKAQEEDMKPKFSSDGGENTVG